MIYTKFGSKVTIVRKHQDFDTSGWIEVKHEDGTEQQVQLSDLKADGGISEINTVILSSPVGRTNC